jgi:hypothetical protein
MKERVVVLSLVTLLLQNSGFISFRPKIIQNQNFLRPIPDLLRMAVTDAPPKVDNLAMTGMFTNSSPESRRVIPTTLEGKTKFKIVYVVLESQYQSALTKACDSINNGKEGVSVEAVGYLLEELRNPNVLEQFKADVADANIFIGSLIFIQELADKVGHILAGKSSVIQSMLPS